MRSNQEKPAGGAPGTAAPVRSAQAKANEQNRLETFNRYRALLFSIAYRMLGSVADAEDMLQETFIRWQQSSATEVESPRAFLVTIISRLCINHLQSARVQREQYVGQWLPEPLITDPAGDPLEMMLVDDSVSVAFLLLLERLNPVERAVFILREILDYEYPEIARIVDQTEANCRQILRRARQHAAHGQSRFHTSPEEHSKLLQHFSAASSRGDMEGLLALLSSDVVFYSDGGGKASAVPNPISGAERVARLVLGSLKKFVPDTIVRHIAWINGRPGIVSYFNRRPFSVFTVDVADGRIRNIYLVTNPEKLKRLPMLAVC